MAEAEAGVKEDQPPGSLILLRFERERGLLKKNVYDKVLSHCMAIQAIN